MPVGYRITGIQPRELDGYPDAVKLMYWSWVVQFGIEAKDRDLSQGLDAFGEPLRPISAKTAKYRKSAMTPDGKGDPNAPPLTPGGPLSRTRSLLAGTAYPDRAEFWWRFDPWTGNTWAEILTYQQEDQGRDVFGLSDDSTMWVRQKALAKWMAWRRNPTVITGFEGMANVPPLPAASAEPFDIGQFFGVGKMDLTHATLGVNAPSRAKIQASQQRQGGMTESQLKTFYRSAAPASVQGRPGQTYNRLLQSIWGSPGKGRSAAGVEPLTPPKPRRVAALEPAKIAQKPVAQPPPVVALTIERFAQKALAASRLVPVASRFVESKVWIIDAFNVFIQAHPEVSLAEFKRMLLEAFEKGLLQLGRVDTAAWSGPDAVAKEAASLIPGLPQFTVIRV